MKQPTEKFPCKNCGSGISVVIDSRVSPYGIRRRRKCVACGTRLTTYEAIVEDEPEPRKIPNAIIRLFKELIAEYEHDNGPENIGSPDGVGPASVAEGQTPLPCSEGDRPIKSDRLACNGRAESVTVVDP